MPAHRSIFLHGLRVVVRVPGALFWTFATNFAIALLFSIRLHTQLSSILTHSLAAERLNSAFDLGVVAETFSRLTYMAPATGASSYLGLPVYLACYFILVPGSLFCYRSEVPSRLAILLSSGFAFFWRFLRITLLTAVVSLIILGPLIALQSAWASHVEEHLVGTSALWHELPGLLLILLAAALLRLYFDLVEVYTIQLSDQYLANGHADRRIRRTLRPALRTLRRNFARLYVGFLALTILGFAAVFLTGRVAAHMLAQPRVWPIFLLAQLGLFLMMATRFWQRGAETILACDFPLPPPDDLRRDTVLTPAPLVDDPQPNPEPIAPSLSQPDPAVFHHDV